MRPLSGCVFSCKYISRTKCSNGFSVVANISSTDMGWVGPVLEVSLLFLLIVLLFLALGRQELLGGARLGEGSGHQLADVTAFRLHQLLCTDMEGRNGKCKTQRGTVSSLFAILCQVLGNVGNVLGTLTFLLLLLLMVLTATLMAHKSHSIHTG